MRAPGRARAARARISVQRRWRRCYRHSDVRHRRLRRHPPRPRAAAGRPDAARVPRLRLGRDLGHHAGADRVGARGRQPQRAAREARRRLDRDGLPRRLRRRASPSGPPARASATPAGPPTAASARRTPTRTATAPTACTSSSTASSRTTSQLKERLADVRQRVQLRDRRRGHRPPDRRALRGRPGAAVRAAYARARGPLRVRRDEHRGARGAGRGAPGVPADRRPRRRASSSSPRPCPPSSSTPGGCS